jgi:hypothetical protein
MSFLNKLRDAVTKMILKSPIHPIISQDIAILTLTDPQSGNYLSYPVGFEKMENAYLMIRRGKEICWKKFEHGAPVQLVLDGIKHEGWAVQFSESELDFTSVMSGSELVRKYLPEDYDHGTASISEWKSALADICVLKVKIS